MHDDIRETAAKDHPTCDVRVRQAFAAEFQSFAAHVATDLSALTFARIPVTQDVKVMHSIEPDQRLDRGERLDERRRTVKANCRDASADRRASSQATVVQNDALFRFSVRCFPRSDACDLNMFAEHLQAGNAHRKRVPLDIVGQTPHPKEGKCFVLQPASLSF
jgi:hypothetical protein